MKFQVPITAANIILSVTSSLQDQKTTSRILETLTTLATSGDPISQAGTEIIDCIRKKNGVDCDGTPENPIPLYNNQPLPRETCDDTK